MDENEAEGLLKVEKRWQDVRYDEEGNANSSFPYPPKFIRSEATGELAKRIKAAFTLNNKEDLEYLEYETVYLTEKTVFGGYSEYTQENLTYLKITCGIYEKEFAESYHQSLLETLLEWLDETEEDMEKQENAE